MLSEILLNNLKEEYDIYVDMITLYGSVEPMSFEDWALFVYNLNIEGD